MTTFVMVRFWAQASLEKYRGLRLYPTTLWFILPKQKPHLPSELLDQFFSKFFKGLRSYPGPCWHPLTSLLKLILQSGPNLSISPHQVLHIQEGRWIVQPGSPSLSDLQVQKFAPTTQDPKPRWMQPHFNRKVFMHLNKWNTTKSKITARFN